MERVRYGTSGYAAAVRAYQAGGKARPEVEAAVAAILCDVRERGDASLVEHTRRLEGAELERVGIRVTDREMVRARGALGEELREAIEHAAASIRAFHERGLPQDWEGWNAHGARVGERFLPLRRVGVYVPAGEAPLVSTALMTVVPAQVAGVEEIFACSPARRDGSVDTGVLAALSLLGVGEVYRLGGAVAVGAMTYGTASVARADKIFGPGGVYLTEAKRQVIGEVGVDMLAGPSEVLILADGSAHPEWVAADLLAQAEHGSTSKVALVALDEALPEKVDAALWQQLDALSRGETARRVMESGYWVVDCVSVGEAIAAANDFAPEHLELQVREELEAVVVNGVRTAGAIFAGHHTPTALGDFVAGPNHTLPTGVTGRFGSGLRVTDFQRRSSLTRYDAASLREAQAVALCFAELEGLQGHGRSVSIRTENSL